MTREIFLELRNARFAVDDISETVPKNMPVATTIDTVSYNVIYRNNISAEDWVFDGVDQC